MRSVDFTPTERKLYDAVAAEARSISQMVRNKADQAGSSSIYLVLLLRLRQLCNHPSLCPNVLEVLAKIRDAVQQDEGADAGQAAVQWCVGRERPRRTVSALA